MPEDPVHTAALRVLGVAVNTCLTLGLTETEIRLFVQSTIRTTGEPSTTRPSDGSTLRCPSCRRSGYILRGETLDTFYCSLCREEFDQPGSRS